MADYTCERCKNTYEKVNTKEWNDFKAAEEYLTLYPEGKNGQSSILCEDCHIEFMKWFEKLTPEQKRKMNE